jgi:protein TonB
MSGPDAAAGPTRSRRAGVAEYELREAERYVGADAAERKLVVRSAIGAVLLHAVLLGGRLPAWGPDPVRVDAPSEVMQVQFLKPPAPPPAAPPKPPEPETKKIARPDPTPEEPEPVIEEPPPAPEPEPEPMGPARVAAGQGPGLVKKVEPIYPPIARAARLQGTVVLDAVINSDGSVGEIRVLESANPIFEQSAIDALKQWRFTPGDHDVIMTLTVNYILK